MRKLTLLSIFLLSVFFLLPPPQFSMAIPREQDRQLLEGAERNLLRNPGFEARTAKWTKTGSSTLALDSGTPAFGKLSAQWDASATGEFLTSELATVPDGLKNRNCVLSGQYKWAGSSGDLKAQVYDGTSVLGEVILEPAVDWATVPPLAFTCPTSGGISWRLESTADAALISLDALVLGKLDTIQVSQAVHVGSIEWAPVGGCAWNRNAGTYANFPNDPQCAGTTITVEGGLIDLSAGQRPAFGIKNGKPGSYQVVVTGEIGGVTNAGQSGWGGQFRLHDGVNQYGQEVRFHEAENANGGTYHNSIPSMQFSWTQTTQISDTTEINVQGLINLGVANIHLFADQVPIKISVYYYPASSAEAITLETSGWYASGYIQAATTNAILGGLIPVLSPVNHTDWTLSTYPGSAPMKISCLGADSTGSDCGANQETMGFSVDVPYAGDYEICFDISHYINEGATGVFGEINASWDIVRTANADHTIVLDNYGPSTSSGAGTSNSAGTTTQTLIPVRACAVAKLSSAGKQTFHLMRTQAYNGTISTHLLLADVATKRKASITMTALTQQLPTPVFTDLTNSLNKKVESSAELHIEKFRFGGASDITACTGACTLYRATPGVVSITRPSLGAYNIAFAPGIFSEPPSCTTSGGGNATLRALGFLPPVAPTATSFVIFYQNTSLGTGIDVFADVVCIGRR